MNRRIIILGIETSCDETGAALVADGRMLCERTTTQTLHQLHGGVVPELASRAHEQLLAASVRAVLGEAGIQPSDLSAVAATAGPGLAGALLVGASFAKGLSQSLGIPYFAVNHLEGHLWSAELEGKTVPEPFLALIVSGGHTLLIDVEGFGKYRCLASTVDDAAGEVLDKVGRMMGLGFPAGEDLDRLALALRGGSDEEVAPPCVPPLPEGGGVQSELKSHNGVTFPRARLKHDRPGFSFSGLKTAVLNHLQANYPMVNGVFQLEEADRQCIAAGMLSAVRDMLNQGMVTALKEGHYRAILIGGGVSASRFLRRGWSKLAAEWGLPLFIPPARYCTDNGGMIANVGYHRFREGKFSSLDSVIDPSLSLGLSESHVS